MEKILNRNRTMVLCVLCLAILYAGKSAHAVKIIEPGLGTINKTIMGDTLKGGVRTETSYILRRNGYYIYTQLMTYSGFHLTIEAEKGTGAKPVLKPLAIVGASPRPFQINSGGLTLRNIHVDGYDNSLPPPGLQAANPPIRVSGDRVRVIIDSCRFDRNARQLFRSDNPKTTWIITNSVFSNNSSTGDPNSSEFFTSRHNIIDTLILANSTVYNHSIFDSRTSGDGYQYFKIEHCTFVNWFGGPGNSLKTDTLRAGEHRNWAVVRMHEANRAVFRNNLLINCGFMGRHKKSPPLIPMYVVCIDSILVGTKTVLPEAVDVRNNNIWFDPGLAQTYKTLGDSMSMYEPAQFYHPILQGYIDKGGRSGSLKNVSVKFADGLRTPTEFITDFHKGVRTMFMPRDSRITSGADMEKWPLNFSYTDAALLTASTQGQPLGDLNWFGMKMLPTKDDFVTTGVERADRDLPAKFNLSQNYPNPFNPATTIQFTLSQRAQVRLAVFNALGQEVETLIDNTMLNPNSYEVRFNAKDLPSGIYFYQLESDNVVSTQKMLLLR